MCSKGASTRHSRAGQNHHEQAIDWIRSESRRPRRRSVVDRVGPRDAAGPLDAAAAGGIPAQRPHDHAGRRPERRPAVSQPGLSAYPDFVAGQAVRSALSPDGATLAVITAGHNSLYKADGTVDVPNSTQYVFLYDVQGENKRSPALKQVLKQTNAHVGLVFAPDGGTLYATGGSDDAVYVYTRSGGSFTSAGSIPLGHYPPGATGNARQKGLGIGVQPNAAGLDVSADGKTLVVANNYNDSITRHRHRVAQRPLRARPAPYFAANEGRAGLPGGTFPFGVVMKGNGVAYVSSDRDREVVAIDVSSPAAGG